MKSHFTANRNVSLVSELLPSFVTSCTKKVGGEDSGHDARKMSHQHCSAKMITLMASSVVLYYSSCYNLG